MSENNSKEPREKKPPFERHSFTHEFSIAGLEGSLRVGIYPDTKMPCEIGITVGKHGSILAGVMEALGESVSMGLQYGIPLEEFCNKFSGMRFEPNGFTHNRRIPIAHSIVDYLFRYLSMMYIESFPEVTDESFMCHECGNGLVDSNGQCSNCSV